MGLNVASGGQSDKIGQLSDMKTLKWTQLTDRAMQGPGLEPGKGLQLPASPPFIVHPGIEQEEEEEEEEHMCFVQK